MSNSTELIKQASQSAWQNENDVVDGIKDLMDAFDVELPMCTPFAKAYLVTTKHITEKIKNRNFEDNTWMQQYLVNFAEKYRKAVHSFAQGQGAVPEAWKVALNEGENTSISTFQHLALGVNAHVSYDLPITLWEVDFNRSPNRKSDHDSINTFIRNRFIDEITGLISNNNTARFWEFIDATFLRIDEYFLSHIIAKARTQAWNVALQLSNTTTTINEVNAKAKKIADLLAAETIAGISTYGINPDNPTVNINPEELKQKRQEIVEQWFDEDFKQIEGEFLKTTKRNN